MPAKKVQMKAKPSSNSPSVDQWVEHRSTEPETPAPAEPTKPKLKRLTLDIDESLHRAIKLKATELGVPMADMLRELLEQHYG
jgi:predicted DNA binding CopG/RHH family protein